MALYGNNPTATATVGANTNVVTIAGIDLSLVTPGMTINLGGRDRKVGDAWIIASVAPTGSNGGTLTTQGSIPTAYNSVPFIIDTTGYLGTDASYAAAVGLTILSTLSTLLGVATNLYSGARQLVMDKASSAAVSRFVFSIAGRTWGDISHRSHTFTPTGGQTTAIEAMVLRAFADGTTPSDVLLVDLTTGTGDLRIGSTLMVSGTTVDLGSSPAGKVTITGSATISSFGAGRNLVRFCDFAASGAVLKHGPNLILPGGVDIVAQAGDAFLATSYSGGSWRVQVYTRANGRPVVPSIPFTPVQQGGGTGQMGNKIYLGWDGTTLRGQVDALELGGIWSDLLAGKSFAETGYQRLPSGLILQWGKAVAGASATDFVQNFPIQFPTAALGAVSAIEANTPANTTYTTHVDQVGRSGFAIRNRAIVNGGIVRAEPALTSRWLAWGI